MLIAGPLLWRASRRDTFRILLSRDLTPVFFLPALGGDFVFDEVAVEIPLMVREDQTRDLGTCMVRAKLFELEGPF